MLSHRFLQSGIAALAASCAFTVCADEGAGWYTSEQAAKGHLQYAGKCGVCHGADLKGGGAPELKGPGFAKSSQELQIEEGRVYRLDFTLHPGGTIKGKVVDARGRPIADGDVFYREGSTSFGVPIEQDGTYRIEGLAPGQYKVTVVTGERETSHIGQVEAGKETLMDFIVPVVQ